MDKEKTKTSVGCLKKKTENNVDVTRNHIRKKQNAPQEEGLQVSIATC